MKQEGDQQSSVDKPLVERDSPRFGRLLIVLLFAVALVVVITVASEAYYTN
jgi:hypothetical protein